MSNESVSFRVPIRSDDDVLSARTRARSLAVHIGFDSGDVTDVAAVVSQLSRSILQYALAGELLVEATYDDGRRGIVVTARHDSPASHDRRDGNDGNDAHISNGRLFRSLSRAGSLMDEFTIKPVADGGEVVAKKWLTAR